MPVLGPSRIQRSPTGRTVTTGAFAFSSNVFNPGSTQSRCLSSPAFVSRITSRGILNWLGENVVSWTASFTSEPLTSQLTLKCGCPGR